MQFLIGILIFISFLIFAYLYLKKKLSSISKQYFGTPYLKEALKKIEIENEETPKSLGSLDSLYLSNLEKDFPDFNLNELKSVAESILLEIYLVIQKEDLSLLSNKNEKIVTYTGIKLEEKQKKKIEYNNLKIHKTVLNKYEKNKGIATIYLATAFEYYEDKNDYRKKVQKRIKTEFIYIIDQTLIKNTNLKSLGLNCPNCGAPIKTLQHKKCVYCKSGIVDIIKKTFVLNNINDY